MHSAWITLLISKRARRAMRRQDWSLYQLFLAGFEAQVACSKPIDK